MASHQKRNSGREIAQALRAAYLHMHRQTLLALSAFEITPEQFVLLRILSDEDGLTQQELTRRATSDPNTVRAVLLILERKGLVVRKPHRTDRRAHQVFLTARATRTYDNMSVALQPLQTALQSPFPGQKSAELVAALNLVVESMKQHDLATD